MYMLFGGFRLVYGDDLLTGFDSALLRSFLAYLILQSDALKSSQRVAFLLGTPNVRNCDGSWTK